MIGRVLNIIEANHRNIARDVVPVTAQGFNGSDRGDVVEREQRGKADLSFQQTLRYPIAQFWGGEIVIELDCEPGQDVESKTGGDFVNGFPPCRRIGTELLSFDEGDAPVPEFRQVAKRELGGAIVIQDNAGYGISANLSRNFDHRGRQIARARSVNSDDSVDRPRYQKARILIDKVRQMAMARDKIKISRAQQMTLNSAEYE
jgi:hypothetical protein